MLRGVQGLAPARGRRRNACAGNIVTPHSLIQRWLALLYYLYYLRLAALYIFKLERLYFRLPLMLPEKAA